MPFRDPILGGDQLVRTAMRSPNYVAGASGWRIARNGSVEFNSGTFRGSLSAGANPGQHFVVNDTGGTGDIVDAYDSSNRLVFSIDQSGTIAQISYGLGTRIDVSNGDISFRDINNLSPQRTPQVFFDSTGSYRLFFTSGSHQPSAFDAELIAQGESGNNTKDNALYGVQRGSVVGNILQNDNGAGAPSNNLVHLGSYSGTTNASGHLIIPHGCGFTPKGCIPIGNAAGTFANLTAGVNSAGFTATNFDTSWINAAAGTPFANLLITMYAILWG